MSSTAAGDVGANPGRMEQAASALESLHGALAEHVPAIVSIMNEYRGGGVDLNLGILRQAQGRAPQDAADMRSRARLAQSMNATTTVSWPGHPGMVAIPWDSQEADAVLEAQDLKTAETSKNPELAMVSIQAIEQDIQDHVDAGSQELAWLSAFYNQAGPQLARLAGVLHTWNSSAASTASEQLPVFSTQDEHILNVYATGLATVDHAGQLKQSTISQLTQTSTLWSASMLLKYGPSGTAYSPLDPTHDSQGFLAQLTVAAYKAEQDGQLNIPLGGKYPIPVQDYQQVCTVLQQVDPVSTLLHLDAENRVAAMQVLSGPDGRRIASYLLNGAQLRYSYDDFGDPPAKNFIALSEAAPIKEPSEAYETGVPDATIGAFLDAATSAPRGGTPAAWQSATAAYNIISQTPAPLIEGVEWQEPPPVRQALLNTYARYLPDLAASVNGPLSSPVISAEGVYVVGVSRGQAADFLQELVLDRADLAKMKAMAGLAAGTSVGLLAERVHPPGLVQPVQGFGALYGLIGTVASNVGISQAEQEDLQNQNLNSMISLAEAGSGVIPGGGSAMDAAKALASVTAPQMPQFSTNNEAIAIAKADNAAGRAQLTAEIPLIQGLVKTGALRIPPPPNAFDSNGNPTVALGNWWRDVGAGEIVKGKTLEDWLQEVQQAMNVQQLAEGDQG